jgi:hypothetical protein
MPGIAAAAFRYDPIADVDGVAARLPALVEIGKRRRALPKTDGHDLVFPNARQPGIRFVSPRHPGDSAIMVATNKKPKTLLNINISVLLVYQRDRHSSTRSFSD